MDLYSNTISDVSPLANLTQLTYLRLGGNTISDVSPLANLTQLTSVDLYSNTISDVSPLANLTQLTYLRLGGNTISDVSPLANLTQLTYLELGNNAISDVSPLANLTQLTYLNLYNNAISDVSPLAGLNLTGTQWDSTGLDLKLNPLNYASINTHIPAMQARGIEVKLDSRAPTTLVKISGTAQQGVVNTTLPLLFVVEVRDQQNRAFAGVPVTFSVTANGGRLSATTATTDLNGRAQAHLTLGQTPGTNTVRVTATEISQPVQFTATGTRLSTPVAILDTNLHTQIAAALGKTPRHSITVADMLALTELTANNANIRDLTGLQQASNLTKLLLDDNNISDVAPLEALTRLKTLSLDDNNIADVAPLTGLPELTTLSLENNSLSDVAPLADLPKLKMLYVRGNLLSYPSLHTHIRVIQTGGTTVTVDTRIPTTLIKVSSTHGVVGAALSLIVEVQDENGVRFAGVPVTFSVTAGGGSLFTANVITDRTGRARTTLTLGATPGKNAVRAAATDAPRPANFTVTAIDANSRVTIRDANLRAKIAEILSKPQGVQLTAGDMLGLTRLEVPNANIQDLTGLEHAHNLRQVNLGDEYIQGEGSVNNNAVSDFSPLFGLAQLTDLNLSSSSLSDVSFLENLTQLTFVQLSSDTISDVSPLANLTQLTRLNLYNNAISDISPLANLTQLTSVDLYSNTISDVSPLANLTQLTYLRLGGNTISDVSPLANLTQLTYLELGNNAISDVSPLANLTQLTYLNLYNNAISDVSPLAGLNLTGTQWDSTGLDLKLNPLNYASINTHIPAMQARGIEVEFDPRTYPALDIISGTGQQAAGGDTLENPFVAAAIDARGTPRGVAVTCAVWLYLRRDSWHG